MDDKSFHIYQLAKVVCGQESENIEANKIKKMFILVPFANVNVVDQVLHQLERAFLLRSCSDNFFNSRKRPCILYQIKRCSAPCTDLINSINI